MRFSPGARVRSPSAHPPKRQIPIAALADRFSRVQRPHIRRGVRRREPVITANPFTRIPDFIEQPCDRIRVIRRATQRRRALMSTLRLAINVTSPRRPERLPAVQTRRQVRLQRGPPGLLTRARFLCSALPGGLMLAEFGSPTFPYLPVC
jgi:hypothetical protein